jgi:hypothetical protein
MIPILKDFGLVVQVEQELSVRYTTASVRSSVLSVESYAHERAAEPATKRVPSFFQRESEPEPAYEIVRKQPVVRSESESVSRRDG